MTLSIPAKVLIQVWSYDVIHWKTATSYDKLRLNYVSGGHSGPVCSKHSMPWKLVFRRKQDEARDDQDQTQPNKDP